MIPSGELDRFRADLTTTLRLYQRASATDIGQEALRQFAEALDSRRERYDDALSGDSAKALLPSTRDAVISVNSGMETLAGLLRGLASLVAAFQTPTLSGGLPGLDDDLATLDKRLGVAKKAIAQLIEDVDATQSVLSRPSRGATKGRIPPQTRSYWHGRMAVGAEYEL